MFQMMQWDPSSHGWLLNPWNVASAGKELAFNTFSNLDFFKVRYSRVASGHSIGQCGSRVIHSVPLMNEDTSLATSPTLHEDTGLRGVAVLGGTVSF